MAGNAQQLLFQEISRLLEPLVEAAESSHRRRQLFASLGWNIDAIPGLNGKLSEQLGVLIGAYETLIEIIDHPPESLDELKTAFAALKPLVGAVKELKAAFDDAKQAAPYLDNLLEELLQTLFVLYLARWHPAVYQTANLLTLVESAPVAEPAEPVTTVKGELLVAPHWTTRVRFDRLAPLLKDPAGTLKSYYLAAGLKTAKDAQKVSDLLFPILVRFLAELRLTGTYGVDAGAELDLGKAGNALIQRMLTVRNNRALGEDGLDIGASVVLLSQAENGPGVAVAPFGGVSVTKSLGGWNLDLDVDAALGAFSIGAQGVAMEEGFPDGSVSATARFAKIPNGGGQALLLGSTKGTRLEVSTLTALASLMIDTKGEYDVGLAAEAGASAFILAAGDGDGFLQKVLPGEVRLPFDFGIEWSTGRGLHIRGSAGLEANLPVKTSLLGVLDVDSVHLALRPDDKGLLAQGSMTATIRIGPVSAAIERVGVEARLTKVAAGEVGNLGPVNLDVSFKPPSGAGLTIAAGPVTGGGYLFFDPASEQYAGALQLELGGKVSLGAVGLLTTRLPGNAKGFSLFVLISAEFPPIQLGYGFTLNGVGGLIGVNRTTNVDALRSGIKTGALGSVLFPKDPARNAPEIISNLNAIFPAAADRVLIGPMAKIGWGTPTILTIDLGLVLEMPSPVRLMLLGRLTAILPSEKKPLVRLQMDALGVLDFDKREVSLDATLYDSRLLEFVLTGDMALRASWGKDPNFLLAIGGFNPRFRAPPAFPKLDRVALSLQQGSTLRLRLEAYLALTSNTAQFGARVDLHVEAAGFTVDAYLYFDALFQFSPFAFVVDIGAMAALKYKGHSLIGVKFDMSLSGPTPWHVRGSASFEFLGFDVSVDFDRSFGRQEAPPPPALAYIRPMLIEALQDVRNWSSVLEDHPRVTLREAGTAGERLLVHPLASLTVRQRVAPLGMKITRFGNAEPADGDIFSLEVHGDDGARLSSSAIEVRPVKDHFAPAQFSEMNDAQKLAGPAFQLWQSGMSIAATEIDYPYDPALDVDMAFETVVYGHDPAATETRLAPTPLSARLMEIAAEVGAAARARNRDVSALRTEAFATEDQE